MWRGLFACALALCIGSRPLFADPIVPASGNGSGSPTSLPPIVITATRTETPASKTTADVSVLTESQIEDSPADTLDDLLREVPGFNTFRRSSSVVTAPDDDPEAQGVTLRGIGPGGASRALVLLDGIPLNDGFGGWIYWDEIPLDQIQRIEVVEGGGSNLWGSGAEGGVINLISRPPAGTGVQGQASYGNRNTTADSLAADYQTGPLRIGLQGDFFNTAGWNTVAPDYRGPIDHPSSSVHELFSGRLDYAPTADAAAFLRGSYYHEARDLGTPLRNASATRGFINGGGTISGDFGQAGASLYAHLSDFDEDFTTVNAQRTAETRSQSQHVPSVDTGGAFTWTRAFFQHHQILAGGDYRLIDGKSDDRYYNAAGTALSDHQISSGTQNYFGLFAEDLYRPLENLEIDLSMRGDFFQNLHGRIRDTFPAPPATAHFDNRMRTATSPRLGVRYMPRPWFVLRGGLYEAFRAPTLAELYRQSSVEDLVLKPNPNLSPEFLQGGEAGLEISKLMPGTVFSLTGYWDILHKPISNVVTAVNPVTGEDAERTRENLGRARIRGYELKLDYFLPGIDWGRWSRFNPALFISANYLRSEATLVYNPPDSTLEDRRLTLVPWSSGGGNLSYRDDLLGEATLQIAYQGMQWEDSDNHDRQRAYWLANLTVSHRIPDQRLDNARAFVKIQNLLDNAYIIDRGGGIPKLGTPFLILGGIVIGARAR